MRIGYRGGIATAALRYRQPLGRIAIHDRLSQGRWYSPVPTIGSDTPGGVDRRYVRYGVALRRRGSRGWRNAFMAGPRGIGRPVRRRDRRRSLRGGNRRAVSREDGLWFDVEIEKRDGAGSSAGRPLIRQRQQQNHAAVQRNGQAEQGARPPIDPAPPARQIPALRFKHEAERQAWRLSGERRPQSSPGCV